MTRNTAGRRVPNINRAKFRTYDLEGPVQPDMALLPIGYDRRSGQGAYVMRMDPGVPDWKTCKAGQAFTIYLPRSAWVGNQVDFGGPKR